MQIGVDFSFKLALPTSADSMVGNQMDEWNGVNSGRRNVVYMWWNEEIWEKWGEGGRKTEIDLVMKWNRLPYMLLLNYLNWV